MRSGFAEVLRRHHRAKRGLDWTLRIGKETGNASERFVLLCIKDVKDGADQQCVAGLLPVVPPFERPFGVDQHVGHVLNVANLPFPSPHFQKGIVGRTP
jgi:hypothetical protein